MTQKNKYSCEVSFYGRSGDDHADDRCEVVSWEVDMDGITAGSSSPSVMAYDFAGGNQPVFYIGKQEFHAGSPEELERKIVEFAREVFAESKVSDLDECDAGVVKIPFGVGEPSSDCVVKTIGLSSYSSDPQTLVPDVTTEQTKKIADVLHQFPASCLPDCVRFDSDGGIDQYFSLKDHREESPDRSATNALIAEVTPLVNELLFNTSPELSDEDELSGGISFFPKAFMTAIRQPGATLEVRRAFEIKVSYEYGEEYDMIATEEESADDLFSKFSHVFSGDEPSDSKQTNKGPKL